VFAGGYPTASSGFVNGIGTNARFNGLTGIDFSPDGSFAIFGEQLNDILGEHVAPCNQQNCNDQTFIANSIEPTIAPSSRPTVSSPTAEPTIAPSSLPTVSFLPTAEPTLSPSDFPTSCQPIDHPHPHSHQHSYQPINPRRHQQCSNL